jgi:hypothetical protein
LQFIGKCADYQEFINTVDVILESIAALKGILERSPKIVNENLDN